MNLAAGRGAEGGVQRLHFLLLAARDKGLVGWEGGKRGVKKQKRWVMGRVPRTLYNTSAKCPPSRKDIFELQRVRQEVKCWVARGGGIAFTPLNQDLHSDGKSGGSVLFLPFLFFQRGPR